MQDIGGRREIILRKAGELFAAKGVKQTTVREIGDAVGILSGSLYHHFDSKESMVEEILSTYVDDVLARSEAATAGSADPEARLAGLVRSSFHSLDSHRDACTIFQNDFFALGSLPRFTDLQEKLRRLQRIWLDVLDEGSAVGVFRDDVDPVLFQHLARDAICNSVRWYPSDPRFGVDDVADACIAVLLGGYLGASVELHLTSSA